VYEFTLTVLNVNGDTSGLVFGVFDANYTGSSLSNICGFSASCE